MNMREQVLASAQRLAQQRGFNGFSYADIANEVGIRKASLHHHFPTKTDLGLALVSAYGEDLESGLRKIEDQTVKADLRLRAYVSLYRRALDNDRMCLCGILAAEALTLDTALLPQINRFFARNVEWLAEVIAAGKSQKVFAYSGSASDHGRMFLSALQGALLMARATGDKAAFDRTATILIKGLLKGH
jgi:TetR/AcrR family transcriptional regulator, transcriptional repressor for nem operon